MREDGLSAAKMGGTEVGLGESQRRAWGRRNGDGAGGLGKQKTAYQPGEGEAAQEKREAEADRRPGHGDVCEEGTVPRRGQGCHLAEFQVPGHRQDLLAGGRVAQTTDVKECCHVLLPGGGGGDRCMGASRYTPSPPGTPTPPSCLFQNLSQLWSPFALSISLLHIRSPQILPSHQPP